MDEKEYVWVLVRNRRANDWNNLSEKEPRRYRVKERKKNCVVLFIGKQYPHDQCFATEEECWVAYRKKLMKQQSGSLLTTQLK